MAIGPCSVSPFLMRSLHTVGRGLASSSMRAISSGMLDIKDDVCKTDELDGRVDGVRAREQQRSERGCMHGGKT